MAIYTKVGDNGITSVFGGRKVLKSDQQIVVCGSFDELNSNIGLIISKKILKEDASFLTEIQKDLYKIMAIISGSNISSNFLSDRTKTIEKKIDLLEKKLSKLTQFLLPQGSEIANYFHITRTVCRRTEQSVVLLYQINQTIKNNFILSYINRLSDLLFMYARLYNKNELMIKI